jgi:hypothetical protein
MLKDEIHGLLCTYCIPVLVLSKPVASEIEIIAISEVAIKVARLINPVFLLGIAAINNALINGSNPITVNKLML